MWEKGQGGITYPSEKGRWGRGGESLEISGSIDNGPWSQGYTPRFQDLDFGTWTDGQTTELIKEDIYIYILYINCLVRPSVEVLSVEVLSVGFQDLDKQTDRVYIYIYIYKFSALFRRAAQG
jgi:hypothetical protein